MAKINILIAGGRKLLREGIAALLKNTEARIVGESATVEGAVKLVQPLAVNVVLLNLNQVSYPNAHSVRLLRGASPDVRVVVVATAVTARGLKEVLNAGAAGFITKECGVKDLLQAVRSAAGGKRYLCPEATNLMIDGYTDSGHPPLGSREQEILCRLASGQNVKEIASELKIGPKTVETHRRRLMTKLNHHSIAELIHYAVAEGYVALKSGDDE